MGLKLTLLCDPVDYAYDALGRQTAVTDPLGHTVTTTYDAEGRVLAQRGATYPVDYAYDAYGNKVSMTTYRQESDIPMVGGDVPGAPHAGDTTRWLYDEPSGCMTNKVYADGKGPRYDYTPDGKLARRTWARGIATDYTYDNAGQLVSTSYSDDTPTITMSYDRVGNLVNATTAGVVTNLYAYDLQGHCTNEWQNDFNLTRYYDTLGRSTGYAINGTRQTAIAYDSFGRIATMSVPSGQSNNPNNRTIEQFSWAYLPGSDLKSSLTYPNGLTASWTYDANNQLIQVCNATPTNVISQFDYTYDAAGRRTAITKTGSAFGDLSGSIDSYTYNARSELISARRTKNGQPIPGFSEDFDYDPIGNRRSSSTYNEKGEVQTSTYQANNLNQYTMCTTPGYAAVRGEADPNATVTVNENPAFRLGSYYFGSDLFDNSSSGGLANLETYATLAQTAANGEETEDLVSATTNQVYLAQSPETFAYDDDGNQTLITTKTGRWRVTYNGENRPVLWERVATDSNTLTSNTQTRVSMSFDHQGRRRMYLETAADGSTNRLDRCTYDNYLCVARNRWQPDGTSAADRFVWDPMELVATRPLAFYQPNAQPQLYSIDGNKNVSELVSSADGSISAHYEYAPFGEEILTSGSLALTNPFRFSSEYADDTIALIYYNYRHLEPVTGRWLNRDPVEEAGGLVLYGFCRNNATCFCDSSGLYFGWDDALTLGIGAVAGVVAQGFGDLLRGKCSGWQDYLGSAVSGALYAEAIYLFPAMGPGPVMLAGAASSGIGNIVAQGSKVLTRRQEGIDACEFVISISTGALFARIPSWNMKGVNAGRGSMLAVTRRLSIEIKNGSISSMSFKSWRKAVCATGLEFGSIYALPQNLVNQGLVDLSQNGDWIFEWFFTEVSIESGEGGYWYESQDWELYWMPEYSQGGDYPVWLPDGMKPAPPNNGNSW